MKVKFIQDYRGILTQERYFQEGDTVDFDDAKARTLIKANRCVEVKAKKAKPKAKKK